MNLLQYTFFQHALLGSLLASIACGIIGTYIVTRRLVFISGGITHASFGGIGLGLFAGISPILSAAVFSVLSAFGVEWLSRRKDMREDSAIAVFWTLGMALGIVFQDFNLLDTLLIISLTGLRERTRGRRILSLTDKVSSRLKS